LSPRRKCLSMRISCEPNINLYSFHREYKLSQSAHSACSKPHHLKPSLNDSAAKNQKQSLFKEELCKTDFTPTTLLTLKNIKNSTVWRKHKKERLTAKQVQIHESSEFNLSSYKQDLNLSSLKYNCVGKRSDNPSQSHTI
jgi:hypothetical protein